MERLETLRTIGITGASGFIGSHLVTFLRNHGYRVICFVRKKPAHLTNDERLLTTDSDELDPHVFNGVDCVIHLAGKNLNEHRWNHEEKEALRNSRVVSTELLSKALAKLPTPPQLFLCASAIGIYGDRGSETVDESSKRGNDFLAHLCRDWESATKAAVRAGIRVAQLRTGIVLASDGGALARMLPFFRKGLGGVTGSGEQYMSWITLHDYVRAILHIIQTPILQGPINLVAPHPVTNRELCKTLAHSLHRPLLFFMPSAMVRLLLGEMGSALLLQGVKVNPKRLLESGFVFHYPTLQPAIESILREETREPGGT